MQCAQQLRDALNVRGHVRFFRPPRLTEIARHEHMSSRIAHKHFRPNPRRGHDTEHARLADAIDTQELLGCVARAHDDGITRRPHAPTIVRESMLDPLNRTNGTDTHPQRSGGDRSSGILMYRVAHWAMRVDG